jgi:hypothetical protein
MHGGDEGEQREKGEQTLNQPGGEPGPRKAQNACHRQRKSQVVKQGGRQSPSSKCGSGIRQDECRGNEEWVAKYAYHPHRGSIENPGLSK